MRNKIKAKGICKESHTESNILRSRASTAIWWRDVVRRVVSARNDAVDGVQAALVANVAQSSIRVETKVLCPVVVASWHSVVRASIRVSR